MNDLISMLYEFSVFFYLGLFIIGACIGSFLNVVVLRLPVSLTEQWKRQCHELLSEHGINCDQKPIDDIPSISSPPSRCPMCQQPLKAHHNIPIIGYFLLGGKCAFCNEKISIRYPVVEFFTAVITVCLGTILGPSYQLLFALIFTYSIICLSLIDFDCQLLPDNIVLPLLWIGLLINQFEIFTNLRSAVWGAIIGYMMLWIIYQAHYRLTGKEGMGYGDFKFLAAIGAWFGWQMLPMVILIASISGTIIAIGMMVLKKQGSDVPISFGPYLALAGWIIMIWGHNLSSYFNFYFL